MTTLESNLVGLARHIGHFAVPNNQDTMDYTVQDCNQTIQYPLPSSDPFGPSNAALRESQIDCIDQTEQPRSSPLYELWPTHDSFKSILDEWNGVGAFDVAINGMCYPGGIAALNTEFKSRWRSGMNSMMTKRYSR